MAEETEQNKNVQGAEQEIENIPEVQQELSKVASNPKQNILIIAVAALIVGYIILHFIFNNDSKTKVTEDQEIKLDQQSISKPAESETNPVPAIPQLPEPPKLVEPAPPPPPMLPELPKASGQNDPVNGMQDALPEQDLEVPVALPKDVNAEARQMAKRKSSIILVNGTQTKTSEQMEQEAEFKKRGRMEFVLGKGKIIDAILETAINTDLPSEIRAVVSRDVFSESGKIILIPKGSRVFGVYAADSDGVYGRVAITWNRIDLASGYSITFQGNGVDSLGRKGESGRVDNKFKERLSNAVLMSAFNITLAQTLDKVIKPPINSQTAANNTNTATQMNNLALSIFTDTTKTPAEKTQLICLQVPNSMPDKTSVAYTALVSACNNLNLQTGATFEQKLSSVMSSVSAAATALSSNTSANVQPTQAQSASSDSFKEITNTLKEMIPQDKFTPTTTLDQGTKVKIYVNKDYRFPKAAISKSRLVQ